MTTFQRARNEEQREVRRRAILDAAAGMLVEMSVAEISLNELSRRVGLAKSNVLRYFESREAVLLELLDLAWKEWLAALDSDLAVVDPATPVAERGDLMAEVLASTLVSRPVLCDLIGAQAAVLEHNLSPTVAATYKRAALANVAALSGRMEARMPELGEYDAARFAAAAVMVTGAVWTHTHPSTAMLAAYDAEPELAVLRLDFLTTLRQVLEILLSGFLARSS